MSEGTVGLIILLTMALGSSLVWHCLVNSFVLAVVGATTTAVIAFQVAAYIHLGYLDPFFLIAIATSLVIAAVIALLVGLPFCARRKQRAPEGSAL